MQIHPVRNQISTDLAAQQAQKAQEARDPQRERLERQLKQAQSELERKDNDAYRRQHAKIS